MRSTVVIDASAFIRAAERHPEASAWIERIESGEVLARAPDLIYAEVANGELVRVCARLLRLDAALALVDVLRRLPLSIMPLGDVVVPALRIAGERRLSVYDACYVALADEADAALLTADRTVAEAAVESILFD